MAKRNLSLSLDSTTIPYMGRINFIINDNDAESENTTYTVTSDDTSIIIIDTTDHHIYGLNPGTAIITVTAAATTNFEQTTITETITVSNKASNELYITFTETNWATKMTNIYTVSNTANFYPASTFKYHSFNTLRSKSIGSSTTTETTITFYLGAQGSIELVYIAGSEPNYDYLTGILDNVTDSPLFTVSGTNNNWRIATRDLSAGKHTLLLKYRKDGSGVRSPDAGAIGYIKLVGISPTYYLIKSEGKFYTINSDTELEEVNITSLSGDAFETYGTFKQPPNSLLKTLVDPEVFYWWDNDTNPLIDYSLKVRGTPPLPQVITSKPYTIPASDFIYDLMIESNQTADYNDPEKENVTPGIYYSISFNNGNDWRIYHPDSKIWVTDTSGNSGMSEKILTNIPFAKWKEEMQFWNSKQIQVRISITGTSHYINTVTLDYTESLMKEVF